jgi:hypothetical protein
LLTKSNASQWTGSGTGFTTYQFVWLAPSTTSATIQFQFYTTVIGHYWDLARVSVKDSFGAEKILNGNFSSKSSWNETCGIDSCASLQYYGPGLTLEYFVNCTNSSNYYSVSQTFTILPCATYHISFQIATYTSTATVSNAYVYIY